MQTKPSLATRWATFVFQRETKKGAAIAKMGQCAHIFITILLLVLAIALPILDSARHPLDSILHSMIVAVLSCDLMLHLMLFERRGFIKLLGTRSFREKNKHYSTPQSVSAGWAAFILQRGLKTTKTAFKMSMFAHALWTLALLVVLIGRFYPIHNPMIGSIVHYIIVVTLSCNLMLYLLLFERKGFVELLNKQTSNDVMM